MLLSDDQLAMLRRNAEYAIPHAGERMRNSGDINLADDGRSANFWKVLDLLDMIDILREPARKLWTMEEALGSDDDGSLLQRLMLQEPVVAGLIEIGRRIEREKPYG